MIWLSILITFLTGFSLVNAISTKFSYLEKVGAAYLLGIGTQVFWMLLLDFIGIKVNLGIVYLGSVLVMGLCWSYILFRKKESLREAIWPYNPFLDKPWERVNLPWMAVMLFCVYVLWAVTTKCLFWPTFDFDSISGYDLVGKVFAAEGSFHNSLFMKNGVSLTNMSSRGIYPPLVSGSFAYAYMSGEVSSKIMTSLYYFFFLVLFYGLLRRSAMTHLQTALTIFLVMFMPEMTSHAALSQTNMPQAVYTATGFIALYIWFKNKEKNIHFIYLSMFLLAYNSMVRSENVIFGLTAGLAVLYHTINNKSKADIIRLVTYGAVILLPFILWALFLKIHNLRPSESTGAPSLSFAYDAQKFNEWWSLLWYKNEQYHEGIVLSQNFYALIPHLYFFFLPTAFIYVIVRYVTSNEKTKDYWKKELKNELTLIYMTLVPFVLYSILYYLIKYDWDTMRNVMLFSYKRGLFGIMTLFSFFILNNALMKTGFYYVGKFLYGSKA